MGPGPRVRTDVVDLLAVKHTNLTGNLVADSFLAVVHHAGKACEAILQEQQTRMIAELLYVGGIGWTELVLRQSGRGDKSIRELVLQERKRQLEKWGEQNHDALTWMVILVEEIGELALERDRHDNLSYARELVEVVAVVVAIIESYT